MIILKNGEFYNRIQRAAGQRQGEQFPITFNTMPISLYPYTVLAHKKSTTMDAFIFFFSNPLKVLPTLKISTENAITAVEAHYLQSVNRTPGASIYPLEKHWSIQT